MQFYVIDDKATRESAERGVGQIIFRQASDDEVIRHGQRMADERLIAAKKAELDLERAQKAVWDVYPEAYLRPSLAADFDIIGGYTLYPSRYPRFTVSSADELTRLGHGDSVLEAWLAAEKMLTEKHDALR